MGEEDEFLGGGILGNLFKKSKKTSIKKMGEKHNYGSLEREKGRLGKRRVFLSEGPCYSRAVSEEPGRMKGVGRGFEGEGSRKGNSHSFRKREETQANRRRALLTRQYSKRSGARVPVAEHSRCEGDVIKRPSVGSRRCQERGKGMADHSEESRAIWGILHLSRMARGSQKRKSPRERGERPREGGEMARWGTSSQVDARNGTSIPRMAAAGLL